MFLMGFIEGAIHRVVALTSIVYSAVDEDVISAHIDGISDTIRDFIAYYSNFMEIRLTVVGLDRLGAWMTVLQIVWTQKRIVQYEAILNEWKGLILHNMKR